jgi:hypothetical protein
LDGELLETLGRLITVETTKPKRIELNAKAKVPRPITLRESRAIDRERVWAFTDGSGSGWHAAVIVGRDGAHRLLARRREIEGSNVSAEFDGVILALEHAPMGEPLAIVADYLWSMYYILGWQNLFDAYLIERRAVAQRLLIEKAFPSVLFVYHPGHQKDASDFSRLNGMADKLCGKKRARDEIIPAPPRTEAE